MPLTGKAPPPPVVADTRPLRSAWVRFWFTPQDAIGLHLVRFLAGLLFLAWLLPLAGSMESLFGLHGWFDQQAYIQAAQLIKDNQWPADSPSWSVLFLAGGD